MAAKKKETKKKKVVKNSPEERRKLALESLNKKVKIVKPMAEMDASVETLSTGSLGLDLALGRGGMAFGRVYEVYGPNSSGKSTLGIHVVIQAQRRGMRCAYFDIEHSVDPKLFETYGANTLELDLVQHYGGEENLSALEALLQTEAYKVMVIDSVSALIPKAEAEADIEKDHMALQARLMSKALRKLAPQAAATGTLLIFVNQLRTNMNMYSAGDVTSGGTSLGYYTTGRIAIRGPEAKSRQLEDNITKEVYGHTAEHTIKKNKLGIPFKMAPVNLIYGQGYDYWHEAVELAKSLDIIEVKGSWYKYEGENFAQGEDNAAIALHEDKELFKKITDEIKEMTGLKEAYELHSNPGPIYS